MLKIITKLHIRLGWGKYTNDCKLLLLLSDSVDFFCINGKLMNADIPKFTLDWFIELIYKNLLLELDFLTKGGSNCSTIYY